MDQATAVKIAQNYGVPPTPGNLSRIMQEAPHESALLGRSMGMQGGASEEGYDDSILKSQLSKLAGEPQGRVEVGAPQIEKIAEPATVNNPRAKSGATALQGSPATRTGPTAGSRGDELTNAEPRQVADRTGGLDSPSGLSASGSGGEGGIGPWLMALLGASSTAGRNATQPGAGPPIQGQPRLPGPTANPQLEGPNSRTLIAGGAPNPQLTYEPKLGPPANDATYPSGAIDNTAGPPAPNNPERPATRDRVASGRQAPVRPTFSPQEELSQAVMNFRKMFRK